mgnify:CR=1 FL=1
MDEIIKTIITVLVAPLTLGGAAILWKYLEKKSNLRIAELERKVNSSRTQQKRDYGTIYNVLTILMATMKADRCYIIQPHPLKKAQYISVVFEIDEMGILSIKERLTDYPVGNIPVFYGDISTRDFLFYDSINKMKGKRARANFAAIGTESLYIKQLTKEDTWVGSLVIDYLEPPRVAPDYARGEMSAAADKIQYILPPIED